MKNKPLRAGIVGAGYIATWHCDAIRALPGVELAAICDKSLGAAQALAASNGAQAYSDFETMISEAKLDAVHILTPPDSHRDLAIRCAEAGLHCFVEKPVALSAAETADMVSAGRKAGRLMAAGHNFLGLPGYRRLKEAVASGTLGRISMLEVNWCFPLPPLRSGPFGLWLMRSPGNLLVELGPHLYAFAVDLFGPLEISHLDLGKPIDLPGGERRHQSWRILGRAGTVDIAFNISLVETVEDRSLLVRGSTAQARFDYGSDVLITRSENTADLILNPLRVQLSQSLQHLREGGRNAVRQLASLNRKSPYGLSFAGTLGSFYESARSGSALDPKFDMAKAEIVMRGIEDTLALMPKSPAPVRATGTPHPRIMVIGGTGFIGRALTRELVARGHDVRVISRGGTGPFDDIADHVETVALSLRDGDGLARAMQGIDTVFNLAKSTDKTWNAALANDVGVTEGIAEAALAAGVKRLVYTGTIASYDMSDPARKITEATGFPDNMDDRNIYARSKAECERRLLKLRAERGLPVVIARPGIVLGRGGPLQHWGIGRWHGAGAVRLWGNGTNTLPFVLIDDLVDGLIRMMETAGIEGRSYNLVGDPLMSGREYFAAIEQQLAVKVNVASSALSLLFVVDRLKHVLKTGVLRKKGLTPASLKDWKSRAHLSVFDNARSKADLGWAPVSDKSQFVKEAIVEANLFGF
ncbi:NAD-dependent epimerase/dehydratase family protein [Tabrizicola sp. BL-A-41-H6]|uniref:NAD-dependent epimerase/dehydratase family protein n=1 Tax=Tabrizicola sp. BL-A-41-H6 TaxID=3421107 RepID=UPI003D66BC5D